MADFKSLVNDPAFQSLSREDQADLRQRFYEKHIRTDPGLSKAVRCRSPGHSIESIGSGRITAGKLTGCGDYPTAREQRHR